MNGATEGADGGGKRTLLFRRDPSFPFLQALDENGLSPELQRRSANGAAGVQPTSLQENRTMLFTVNTHTHTHVHKYIYTHTHTYTPGYRRLPHS